MFKCLNMSVKSKALVGKIQEASLYHVKHEHSFAFILEKKDSKDINWNKFFKYQLLDLFICFCIFFLSEIDPSLLHAHHSQQVSEFSAPLSCHPLPFLVSASFFRVLFFNKWWIKTLSLLLWSRYKWIRLKFLSKSNYKSVGEVRVLQCRKN